MDRKQNSHISTCGRSEETATRALSFVLCGTEQSEEPKATTADVLQL